jgi:protein O-mannosyl-transferase
MATPPKQPAKKPVTAQKDTLRTKQVLPKGPFHFSGRKFNIIFILSVIGLCFMLYGNTIPNEFSLDDEFVLHNDSIVAKGIKGIPELFKTRYAWDQKGGYGYRPMVKVSFALEYELFKDSPHWGHFINILLYALVCIFLFYFFRKLLYNQLGDYFLLIALALYITHPIHTEVVASLKNRDEILVFLFGFYSCYAMLKWFEEEKTLPRVLWGLSGCFSLGFGALCKPDAIVFIPVTVLILYFFSSNGIRASIFSFLLMTASFLIGNSFMHKHVLPHSDYHRTFVYIENPLVGIHWYHKFPLAFSTIWFYISKLMMRSMHFRVGLISV